MQVQSAIENLERLEQAFDTVKAQLVSQLHSTVRSQLFNHAPPIQQHRPALLPGSTQLDAATTAASQNGASMPQTAQRQ